MGKIGRGLVAALLAAFSAVPGPAQSPGPPAPARWQVDGSTDRCILTRRLEGTPAPATFILRTIPGSRRYDVLLAGRDVPTEIRRDGREVVMALSPGSRSYQGEAHGVDLPGDLDRGVLLGPLPEEFVAAFAAATTLSVAPANGAAAGSWTIPSARRAAEALAFCEAEKQIEWGADPASVAPGATPARAVGELGQWLAPRDLGITVASTEGPAAFAAVFRLVVGPDGRAASCAMVESAGNVDPHGSPCPGLVRRARYEPARDAAGKAVTAVAIYIISLRTRIDFHEVGG